MKIALVSYYSRNYGALLQGYALQEVLKSLGHKVVAINRGWKDYGHLVWDFDYKLSDKIKKKIINYPFDDFVRKEIQLSHPIKSLKDLQETSKEFDVVIAGSDQIWNADTITNMNYYFFLDWVPEGVSKYSYAASFGKDKFVSDEDPRIEVTNLLKSFKGISVREESGVTICSDIFDVKATHHIDPTLLLPSINYLRLINFLPKYKQKHICTYILDRTSEKAKLISYIQQTTAMSLKDNYSHPVRFKQQLFDKSKRMPTVYQWLSNIANAKYVITDSFHGTVFSIIFHKPFVCINNKERGTARFESLLKMFGLENRLVNIEELSNEQVLNLLLLPIDFCKVEEKLKAMRKSALDYLKSLQ